MRPDCTSYEASTVLTKDQRLPHSTQLPYKAQLRTEFVQFVGPTQPNIKKVIKFNFNITQIIIMNDVTYTAQMIYTREFKTVSASS